MYMHKIQSTVTMQYQQCALLQDPSAHCFVKTNKQINSTQYTMSRLWQNQNPMQLKCNGDTGKNFAYTLIIIAVNKRSHRGLLLTWFNFEHGYLIRPTYNYLTKLGLKLMRISKRGPSYRSAGSHFYISDRVTSDFPWATWRVVRCCITG